MIECSITPIYCVITFYLSTTIQTVYSSVYTSHSCINWVIVFLSKTRLYNGVWAWAMNPVKYDHEAVRNYKGEFDGKLQW